MNKLNLLLIARRENTCHRGGKNLEDLGSCQVTFGGIRGSSALLWIGCCQEVRIVLFLGILINVTQEEDQG